MSWKEYPSSSEENFAFAILRMVDLNTIDLNINKMCDDLGEDLQRCGWAVESSVEALCQKYRDDASSPIFDVSIDIPDDWRPHSHIAFGILRQVRMNTYDFERLSEAHDKVSNNGRRALERRFLAFGSKYMDGTRYEKNSSGARDVDTAERYRLQELVKDDQKQLRNALDLIKASKGSDAESIDKLHRKLFMAHMEKVKDLKEIYNPNIRYTLRDIIKSKEELDWDECGSMNSWLKDYVGHIHKLQGIYQNLTLRKIQ